jgi:uncharacterized protein
MIVVLDTNACMMPSQFRIDLFEELRELLGSFEPVVLQEVVSELQGISQGQGNQAAAARFGISLSRMCRNVESGYNEGTVDDRIAGYAKNHGGMVVTNDRILRNLLLSRNIPVISLKNKKKLSIIRR